jgi:phosphatidate cytidylyltransferase
MKKRVITGLILAVILLPIVLVPACLQVLEFVVALLIIIAEFELLNMYDKDKKTPLWLKIVTAGLTLGLSFSIFSFMSMQEITTLDAAGNQIRTHLFDPNSSIILKGLRRLHFDLMFTPVTALLICVLILMSSMIFIHDFEVKDAGRLFLSIIYVGVCSAAFMTLRFFGVRFVIYLLTITTTTDIFALVFGLAFGRSGKHKLAPRISPKKSWEGAIGGTAVALVLGFAFSYFYEKMSSLMASWGTPNFEKMDFFAGVFNYNTFTPAGKVFVCLVLTLLLSITSQIGDLVASKLKRAYGIKDYSQVFPGHGRVLDRFDSVFFASALFLLFIIFEINFIDVLLVSAGI